jgi:hypothetical protein
MVGKNTSVMALFPDSVQCSLAAERLREAGFRSADISVLMADNSGNKDLGHVKETKAPEGTTTGAATGAILGGTLGWLAGIGMLAIPGVGPLIAAGPIMAALAGAGIGGSVGGLTGALVGMGIPEYEAKRFEGMIKEGKALLSVHCDSQDWVKKAKDILDDAGGKDVASRGEAGAQVKGTESDRPFTTAAGMPPLKTTYDELRS